MSEALRFDGRVAIVTGAGMGLGKAHAIELARRGAKVIVNDFNKDAAAGTTAEINSQFGDVAISVVESVTTEAGAKAIVAAAMDTYGKIDVLVNNAGTSYHGNFLEIPRSEYDRIMDANVRGTWEVTRAAWQHLVDARYGRIVMTTSGSGLYGQPAGPEYSASKAADYGLAMSLAVEGQEFGIHVNAVAPAAWTPLSDSLVPEGAKGWFRTLKPEAVSQLVAYLSHEDCKGTGEAWGALRGVVVRYKIASRCLAQAEYTAEDIARASADLGDFTGNCDFHGTLGEHLTALAGLSMGGVDSDSFEMASMAH